MDVQLLSCTMYFRESIGTFLHFILVCTCIFVWSQLKTKRKTITTSGIVIDTFTAVPVDRRRFLRTIAAMHLDFCSVPLRQTLRGEFIFHSISNSHHQSNQFSLFMQFQFLHFLRIVARDEDENAWKTPERADDLVMDHRSVGKK